MGEKFQKHSKAWAIDKIIKLLSMTVENGCYPHEAINAASIAQKMMAEYNVTQSDIELGKIVNSINESIIEQEIHVHRNWVKHLAHVVSSNMRCTMLLSTRNRKSYVRFVGRESDVEVAVATFWMLFDACVCGIQLERERAVREYGNISGIETSYATGFVSAVKDEMGKQCQALMLIVPDDVNDYLRETYPSLGRERVTLRMNGYRANMQAAHSAGYKRGQELTERRKLNN